MTAAGRVKPAQVLVLGAGVAGLAAVAAAQGPGRARCAPSTRAPVVREQVESLGAQFVEFEFEESGEGAGGYAKQMSDAYLAAEQALIAQARAGSDIVITTALIPGKPAPQLITSGAVVGDGARARSSSTWRPSRAATARSPSATRSSRSSGVTIIGLTDLPSRMARQSSELYATTVAQPAHGDVHRREGGWRIDLEDEIQRGALVLKDGELTVAAARAGRAARRRAAAPSRSAAAAKPAPRRPTPAAQTKSGSADMVAVLAAILLGAAASSARRSSSSTSRSSCSRASSAGTSIWNVTPALHTPLMSVTNAISGIILIGGMLGSTAAATRRAGPGRRRGAAGRDQRRGRLPRHAAHAADVPEVTVTAR